MGKSFLPFWSVLSKNILLGLLGVILVLRLTLWKFFSDSDVFLNEIVFAALIIFLALFWLLTKIVKQQTIAKSSFELSIFLIVTAAILSIFHAVDFSSSLRGVLILISEVAFFYMLLDNLDSPRRIRWFIIFMLGMAFIAAIYGIKNYYILLRRPISFEDAIFKSTHSGLYYLLLHRRAVSFFGWPNALAGYFLLFLPLVLIFPFQLKLIWQKYIAGVLMLTVVACFFYTYSFLGWLSFILSVFVFLPFIWQKLNISRWTPRIKRIIFFSGLIFLTCFILVILNKNFLSSLSPRIFYYKAAFVLLAKNPLWGYGWDSFVIISKPLTSISGNLSAYVHNTYLQVWLETGIIGFLGIILLAVLIFKKFKVSVIVFQEQQDLLIFVGIAWGLIAFFIDNLFNFTFLAPNVALFWWAMLGVFCAMIKLNSHPDSEHSVGKESNGAFSSFVSLRMTIIGSLFFIVLVFLFIVSARITSAYMLYNQAMYLAKPGNYSRTILMLNKAKAWDPWDSYIPAGVGSVHLQMYGNLRIKEFLKLAVLDYLEAIQRSPSVYYNYFALSRIYDALGDKGRGQVFTQKAKELSPSEFAIDNIMFQKS